MLIPEYEAEIKLAHSALDSIPDLFLRRDSMDAFMHDRMMDFVNPIIAAYPKASWLTVGDEGADAWMLRQRGASVAAASSISDVRLRKAAELGYLTGIEVRALNAERLDCADASVDLILCRQTYHHVRRAPLAFYEMMRVARAGFVLIEPVEYARRPLEIVRIWGKMLLRGRSPTFDLFEPAGNYIYRVSERDLFQMLAAVQAPWFAIKTFNTFYLTQLAERGRDSLVARSVFRLGIGLQDVLCLARLMSPGMCVAFVPTGHAAEQARDALQMARFRIVPIPRNPYSRGSACAAED